MIEKQSYQEPFSEVDKRKDDEMEIDLMAIFYKIITVRGVLCKACWSGSNNCYSGGIEHSQAIYSKGYPFS